MAEFASEITPTAKNGVWRLPTKAVDSKGDKRHVCTEEVAISGMLFQCKIWVEMIDLAPRLLCDIQMCAVVIPAPSCLLQGAVKWIGKFICLQKGLVHLGYGSQGSVPDLSWHRRATTSMCCSMGLEGQSDGRKRPGRGKT